MGTLHFSHTTRSFLSPRRRFLIIKSNLKNRTGLTALAARAAATEIHTKWQVKHMCQLSQRLSRTKSKGHLSAYTKRSPMFWSISYLALWEWDRWGIPPQDEKWDWLMVSRKDRQRWLPGGPRDGWGWGWWGTPLTYTVSLVTFHALDNLFLLPSAIT